MAGTMNRGAFERLMKENLEYLLKQPRTLERDHIEKMIKDATRVYYDLPNSHHARRDRITSGNDGPLNYEEVAIAARDFVWEGESWEAYQDSKTSNSVAWPPEFLLLCEAVEKSFGPMPFENVTEEASALPDSIASLDEARDAVGTPQDWREKTPPHLAEQAAPHVQEDLRVDRFLGHGNILTDEAIRQEMERIRPLCCFELSYIEKGGEIHLARKAYEGLEKMLNDPARHNPEAKMR